MDEIV
jgi:chromosome segregation ATPase